MQPQRVPLEDDYNEDLLIPIRAATLPSKSLIGSSKHRDATTIEFEINNADQKTWTPDDLPQDKKEDPEHTSIFLSKQKQSKLPFKQVLLMATKFFLSSIYLWAICVALILSILGFILVSLPFGREPYYNSRLNIHNMYFDYQLVLYGTTLPTLMIGIFVATAVVSAWLKKYILWYDSVVSLVFMLFVLVFSAMIPPLFFHVHYFWYALEANISCAFFLITLICTSFYISKLRVNRETNDFTFKQLFKYCIIPVIITAITFSFVFQQLNVLYLEARTGYKIIIRGILWPVFNNLMLGIAEYWSYHVGKKQYKRSKLQLNPNGSLNKHNSIADTEEEIIDIERRNHGLYNLQIGFFLVGRVWISYVETVQDVIVICLIQSFFDILIHRASRPLNMLLTHLCIKKAKEKSKFNTFLTKWRAIFTNEKLLLYRAVIINAEYVADTACILSNAIFIILLIYTKHWHYNSLVWNIPDITVIHMIQFAIIQLLFNMFTHIFCGAFDIKYGNINLKFPWKRRIWTQYISELCAFIGMSFFGSYYLYRQLPNYIQCTDPHDVCSCDFTNDHQKEFHC